MSKKLIEVYKEELDFLLNLKKSIGKLNNRIHDILASFAIEVLKEKYPELDFYYSNAGASGTDIEAKDKSGSIKLLAEVKTTTPGENGNLRGPQAESLKKDLERLKNKDAEHKYLILLSNDVKRLVEHRLSVEENYPDIKIINPLEE